MEAKSALFSDLHRATALAVLSKESDAWSGPEWSRAAIDLASAVVAVGNIKLDDSSDKAELERLREESKLGPQRHRCLNRYCPTVTYGSGYKSCPRCGDTEGRDDA